MACTGYDPQWKPQAGTGLYQWTNCGVVATALAIDDATCGAKKPDPEVIRRQMGDTSGGTNLAQAAFVAERYYGVQIDVRYRLPWAEYETIRKSGRGAYLALDYSAIRDSRFRGSETFGGNHAVYDPPSGRVRDSLADGRRPGLYRFANEVYPRDLLRRAAGELDLGGGRRLGYGLVYAGFTVDNDAAPLTYTVTVGAGSIDWWRVIDGYAQRYIRGATTAGFTRHCTAPRLYPWPGHNPVSLVRVLDGPAAGRYIAATAPRVTVRAQG